MTWEKRQPEVNIGVVGHVDHGKTTLVQAITGIWTAKHSEELRRGMTIKLGYADANIAYCDSLSPPESYTTSESCPDGSPSRLLRRVSFVDAPGHEMLMATMLSGAALMDGAILVVAANEPCPQPQTLEHFVALNIVGVERMFVVQNKVDVVSREQAKKNYEQIRRLLEGTRYEGVPIIPVSALHKVNIDLVLQAIEELIPTPNRDPSKDPLLLIARSFDVNRPGTDVKDLVGGIIGGSIVQGVIRVGDELEMVPGARVPHGKAGYKYEPLITDVVELRFGADSFKEARPGGLVAIGTSLDPSVTKADALVGNVAGKPGRTPPAVDHVEVKYGLLERVVGAREASRMPPLQAKEQLIVTIGTATRVATVTSVSGDTLSLELKEPAAAWMGSRIAISRRIVGRWRLAGWGIVERVATRGA
ncbi:MAG: translation initiation factor IF-2 subunit gamma [Desulfurococcaceae archaeon]